MSMPPVAGTARIIAKLLSSRPTHQHEIPDLIEGVHTALAQLGESREPAAAEISTAPDKGEAPGRRRRHRAASIEPATEAAAPPPAPKLLRRAEVVAPGTSEVSPLLAPRGAVRGIVKWFDAQNRRGALRLPGCGGDVPVNAATLAEAGIARLYKGQEIEATLEGPPETPRLLRVALPGGAGPTATPGIVRGRHAKPVVVELKREGVRRAAARAEAEQLLRPPRPR
jgi:cold shock CspA family protein